MKQIFILFFLMAFAINVNAYDFEAKNADGITIYYNYINNGKELEVTYKAHYKAWDSNKLEYYYYYGGYSYGDKIVVPETVIYNDRSFPVTKIGDNAFRDSGYKYIVLPNSIKNLASSSFQDCSIVEITIPQNITEIKVSTFAGCKYLNKISLPDGLKEIAISAFDGCTSLKTISIPESVTILKGFTECTGLSSITIPKNVTDVYFYGCTNLLKVHSNIEEPNDISTIAFADNSYYSGTLYVPKGTIDKYKSKEGWKKFNFIEEMSSDKQCAIPVLSYSNKELSYTCETNGATIHETIKCSDAVTTTFSGSHKLNAVYEISAYATADGYSQSETINAKLYWLDGSLETSNVSNIKANMRGVLIQRNDDFLTISGLANNEKVIVFDISGRQIGNSQSVDGTATFCINKTEKIIVVKIGNESIKVQL